MEETFTPEMKEQGFSTVFCLTHSAEIGEQTITLISGTVVFPKELKGNRLVRLLVTKEEPDSEAPLTFKDWTEFKQFIGLLIQFFKADEAKMRAAAKEAAAKEE